MLSYGNAGSLALNTPGFLQNGQEGIEILRQ